MGRLARLPARTGGRRLASSLAARWLVQPAAEKPDDLRKRSGRSRRCVRRQLGGGDRLVEGVSAAGIGTRSAATPFAHSAAAMSADCSYGTSVSSVPWTSSVAGKSGEMLHIGRYAFSAVASATGSRLVTSQSRFRADGNGRKTATVRRRDRFQTPWSIRRRVLHPRSRCEAREIERARLRIPRSGDVAVAVERNQSCRVWAGAEPLPSA